MKVGFKRFIIFMAFVAAVSMAFDSYNVCKAKCLRKAFCKDAMAKIRTCCKAKSHPVKTVPVKCESKKTCCFKKVCRIATIDDQPASVDTTESPVFFANAISSKYNNILKVATFSTGPPVQFKNNSQSILCIFVI
jgi:hypothetical protein